MILFSLFSKRKVKDPRTEALKVLQGAYAAYRDAKVRGDTRDLHAAQERLRSARTAQLRMELGR